MSLALPRLALLLVVAAAPVALARGSYGANVPNYPTFDCQTCHITTNPNVLNDFGDAFNAAGHNASSWAAVFDADADGDGQSNAEELGDPCGSFTAGSTPARNTQISNPGLASSTSSTPFAPDGDDDEWSDGCDNCPADANTDQADADDDGTGDVCEGGAGEGEGEGEEGEGEGDAGEGEGEGDAGGEGEGEGVDGPCTSSSVSRTGPQSSALASLALLALVALRRRR